MTENSGAYLSLFTVSRDSFYSHFHFTARSLRLLLPCPLDILCCSSTTSCQVSPSPQILRRASRWRCRQRSCQRPVTIVRAAPREPASLLGACLPSSLGLFPVCSPQSEPWLGCCCGGDAERMMKPHKNTFVLLLERVGKARGERKKGTRGEARLAHLMPTWLFC